jgi:hypothetical protein
MQCRSINKQIAGILLAFFIICVVFCPLRSGDEKMAASEESCQLSLRLIVSEVNSKLVNV